MRIFTFILCQLLLSLSLFSQETVTDSQEPELLGFGLEINPYITIQQFEQADLARAGFPHGIRLALLGHMNMNPRVDLKVGLSLNMIQINQDDFSKIFPCDVTPQGFTNNHRSRIHSREQKLYAGMPVNFKFKLSTNPSHVYIHLGGEALVHIGSNSTHQIYECGSIKAIEVDFPFRQSTPILVMARAGAGYECELKNQSGFFKSIYMECIVGQSINDLFSPLRPQTTGDDGINNSKILQLGAVVGFRIR